MEAARFENVFFRYHQENEWVLKDLNTSIQPGEWVSIVGPNGSGKSTLARLFNGIYIPAHGLVHIDGMQTKEEASLPEIRKRVGIVFQNPDHQFVAPTVRDDIAFGMENAGIEREEMKKRITQVARHTGISDILDQEPHRLSGGQKQRAAIAGVLALHPNIIILDEATSMLDPKGREEVMATVKVLHKNEKVTIVSVTHRLEEALRAERVWYMEMGRLAFDMPSERLFYDLYKLEEKQVPLPYEFALLQELRRQGQSVRTLETYIRENLDI